MTTGQRMKARRKEIGLSAEYVAAQLGVSPATIYRYENGGIDKVPGDRLAPIAKVLQTTPAYLMGWDYDENDVSQELLDTMEEISRHKQEKNNRIISTSALDRYDASTAKIGDIFEDGHVMLTHLEKNPDGSLDVRFRMDGENPFQEALLTSFIGSKLAGKKPIEEDIKKSAYDLGKDIVQASVKDFLDKATPEQRKKFDEEMKDVYTKIYEIFFGSTGDDTPDK